MAKPGDFFVGIIDLFSIFIPGGVFTFSIYRGYSSFFLEAITLSDNQYWIAFLFSSYLLGHIIFMVGSKLDAIYNFHREKRNPYTNESAFQCASNIMHKFLTKNELQSVNTYQWATSILTTHFPEATVEINRFVADSKFFRSLVVILPITSVIFILKANFLQASIVFLFIVPCYMRYYDRRLKSTTRAYQYIIMLHGLGKLVPPNNQVKGNE